MDAGIVRPIEIAPGIERIEGFFPAAFLAIQTTRLGGQSHAPYASFNLATHVGDDPKDVAANRARLAQHLPHEPLWLQQVHGTAVARPAPVSMDASVAELPVADASITSTSQPAVVMTADCLPLIVAQAGSGQCAAIHAGWKGLALGVVEATLNQMAQAPRLGDATINDDWHIWLGPCIGPAAFEVGRDVLEAFTQDDPGASCAFSAKPNAKDKWMADLSQLAMRRLIRWSERLRNATSGHRARLVLARSGECVYCDPERYFSFRRDRITGRMASLICHLS